MIKAYSYHSPQSGPHILFLGAIHGDEPCGTYALQRIQKQIENKDVILQQGTLTLIPIANPQAFKQNRTYIDCNLNRNFRYHAQPQHYEHLLANTIIPYIKQADIIVDLHSTTAVGESNVFQDYLTPDNTELAQATGQTWIIQGRPECEDNEPQPNTLSYSHSQGKTAVLVECGQHQDSNSTNIAYQTVENILAYYQMIPSVEQHHSSQQKIIRMTSIVYKSNKFDHLLQKFKHLQYIQRGTPLAIVNQKIQTMPYDGYIIMPKTNASIGQELRSIAKPISSQAHSG